MKLITLNTWGGKVFDPLMEFVKTYKADTDIFCFQEVVDTQTNNTQDGECRINLLAELKNVLTEYQVFYRPTQNKWIPVKNVRVDYPVSYGPATFVKKSIPLLKEGEIFVYSERNAMKDNNFDTLPRNFHWIQFQMNNKSYTVCNIHGYWKAGPKIDSPERIKQSEVIKQFLDSQSGEKIVCGDFNLLPNTESMNILEKDLPPLSKASAKEGLRNLVMENNIPTTRSTLYDWDDKFADYILVSPTLEVEKFEVLQDQVSDHLPLFLEFS